MRIKFIHRCAKLFSIKCKSSLTLLANKVIMSKIKNDASGMRGERSKNNDGQLRDKRNDTHMGTIENQYGRDFNVRSDMQLGTYLQQNNIASLNDLIHSDRGKNK